MKNWVEPEVEALDMACTKYSGKSSQSYDDVRADQNGMYWFSFNSEEGVPTPTGKGEKID
ncbi:MAG: hypothetical protein HDT30_14165 [Clostridiales bacterium]|nr:hypothetical protein [Clostridiales bacterium]